MADRAMAPATNKADDRRRSALECAETMLALSRAPSDAAGTSRPRAYSYDAPNWLDVIDEQIASGAWGVSDMYEQ